MRTDISPLNGSTVLYIILYSVVRPYFRTDIFGATPCAMGWTAPMRWPLLTRFGFSLLLTSASELLSLLHAHLLTPCTLQSVPVSKSMALHVSESLSEGQHKIGTQNHLCILRFKQVSKCRLKPPYFGCFSYTTFSSCIPNQKYFMSLVSVIGCGQETCTCSTDAIPRSKVSRQTLRRCKAMNFNGQHTSSILLFISRSSSPSSFSFLGRQRLRGNC